MKKRGNVSFDKRFFSKNFSSFKDSSIAERFSYIHKNNHWVGQSTVSGEGSEEKQTQEVRTNLPKIISQFKIRTILDIPCGDFNWMKNIELNIKQYIGGDIVPEIIEQNNTRYSNDNRKFLQLDIIKNKLPMVDLIFCRDCLVHLSIEDIQKSIENIKNSNSQYILTTTFTECEVNEDIITGDWRIINLCQDPFNFPEPILVINEDCTEGNKTFSDKSLGLWKISDL
ncbi:MAG: class I SAM-dependent methyltransferase [Bacteroidales bacterium]|nr:class I SAM-dependent methyltransferase [Bacteroidales bacterium]